MIPLAGTHSATASFRFCRDLVRQSRSNFALAFRLLPVSERRAMEAIYAFMRVTDDISDEPGDGTEKRAKLSAWRESLAAALVGHDAHPLHPALRQTVVAYGVDPKYLFEVIDGVAADLDPVGFATFDELYPYCFRVASAVGLACLPVWGCRDPRAAVPGEAAGIAFQLTNVLRDLSEDLRLGRVYLPREEWERFACPPETWAARGPNFAAMMGWQIDRAKQYYTAAEALNKFLPPPGRAIYRVMFRTYRALLAEIEIRGGDVFGDRVRVPRRKKAMIFAAAWPVKWGWW